LGIVGTEYGKALGGGLYEFRLRHTADEVLARRRPVGAVRRLAARAVGESVLLRVFFAAHDDRVILLLGGYDKGRFPTKKKQQREIELARSRLSDWGQRERSG
jgi:hypothetical protein